MRIDPNHTRIRIFGHRPRNGTNRKRMISSQSERELSRFAGCADSLVGLFAPIACLEIRKGRKRQGGHWDEKSRIEEGSERRYPEGGFDIGNFRVRIIIKLDDFDISAIHLKK